ncbi:hypothetical protein Barb4_00416 [Bacteroidales bacterium Barb4]|nr:hypothetical protein Barb4_00416 [Bacteroidales bacterium Barb4]
MKSKRRLLHRLSLFTDYILTFHSSPYQFVSISFKQRTSFQTEFRNIVRNGQPVRQTFMQIADDYKVEIAQIYGICFQLP